MDASSSSSSAQTKFTPVALPTLNVKFVEPRFANADLERAYGLLRDILGILRAEWDAWSVSPANKTINAITQAQISLDRWMRWLQEPDAATAVKLLVVDMQTGGGLNVRESLTKKTIRRPTPAWDPESHFGREVPATLAMKRDEVIAAISSKLAEFFRVMWRLAELLPATTQAV